MPVFLTAVGAWGKRKQREFSQLLYTARQESEEGSSESDGSGEWSHLKHISIDVASLVLCDDMDLQQKGICSQVLMQIIMFFAVLS